jgi:hypothetical protein
VGPTIDCITDNLTGLVWVQNLNNVNSGNFSTFANAQIAVSTLNLCGYNNWRLPTVTELRSLVNYAVTSSTGANLEGWFFIQGFSSVQKDNYWTDTPYAPGSTTNWVVDMGSGADNQGTFSFISTSSNAYIWPVAGGVSLP